MASVQIGLDTHIDYSIKDGRIREFVLDGRTLYDETKDVAADGWKDKLWELVKIMNMHVDDGHGLDAFVYKLKEEYEE